jgi:hypothetical protein
MKIQNGDGVLWPGNVVAVSPGAVTTDSTGRATIFVAVCRIAGTLGSSTADRHGACVGHRIAS